MEEEDGKDCGVSRRTNNLMWCLNQVTDDLVVEVVDLSRRKHSRMWEPYWVNNHKLDYLYVKFYNQIKIFG